MDTVMYCKECGREEAVSFGACLFGKRPWPRCHGKQMAFREQPSAETIDRAVGGELAPVRATIRAAQEHSQG